MSKKRRQIQTIIRYSLLIGVAIIMLYPMIWLIGATFKSNNEIFISAWFWPSNNFSDFSSWLAAFKTPGWGSGQGHGLIRAFINTLRYAIPQTIFMTFTCLIVAYVVARMHFVGKKVVFAIVIGTLLMPNTVFRIPMYLFWQQLGFLWKNKLPYLPLWAGSLFAVNSFSIFMYIQFFRSIPRDLDEAAAMDGCNTFQILFKVLVPVLKPIIVTVALLLFIAAYNDFQGPLIYVTNVDYYTVSQVLKIYVNPDSATTYSQVFARSYIALLPLIIIFFISQKYFVSGMVDSAIKG
jgi:oligogalacturonide transport system permease protein